MNKILSLVDSPRPAIAILILLFFSFNNWLLGLWLNYPLISHGGAVSELSAATQPHYLAFRMLDIVAGVIFIYFAAATHKHLRRQKLGRYMLICVAAFGLANIIDALLPLNCSESLDHGCRLNVNLSWSHFLLPPHSYSSVVIASLYFILPLLGYLYAKKYSLPSNVRSISLIAVLASLFFFGAAVEGYIANHSFTERTLGPTQEVHMTIFMLWFLVWIYSFILQSKKAQNQ